MNNNPSYISVGGKSPQLGEGSWVAPGAFVIGDFCCGKECSIWFNAVVRADRHSIRFGDRVNIQDNAVVHITQVTGPVVLGDDVTVGHQATVHACTIGSRVLIGMGAVVLDGAVIPDDCFVAAGAVVTPGSQFEPGSMIMGSPAKKKRDLTETEMAFLKESAATYLEYKNLY